MLLTVYFLMTSMSSRKVVSVTMMSQLYERLVRHCKQEDIALSVWVRELIKRELDARTPT